MAVLWLALAANEGLREGLREWQLQLLKVSPILAGLLLLLAIVVAWMNKRRRAEEDDVSSPSDQLAYFQELHWRGELSKAEYDRIASLLEERIRQEQAPAPSGPPPSQPDGSPRPPLPPETGIRPQPPG